MLTAGHSSVPANRDKAFCLMTLDGVILTCNPAMLALIGKRSDEIVEHHCHDVFSCAAPREDGCPLAKTALSHRKAVARIRRGDGHIEEATDPLFDASGIMSAVMLSVCESPKSRAGVPDLIRIERLATMAQATGGIVHDFNNIFARIASAAALLKEERTGEPGATDPSSLMAAIETSVEQGKVLTDQLLEFGRGHDPEKAPIVLTAVIRKAVSFAAIGGTARPSVDIPEDLWPVNANAGQMTQLISNLTINALHAAGKGKQIWISADNVPEQAARDAGLEPRRHVKIAVRDKGHGIPRDHFDRLFEPFFTTKEHGTGLGLATASLIAREHQGHIAVESEVGRGTTFTVFLPAAEPLRGKRAG